MQQIMLDRSRNNDMNSYNMVFMFAIFKRFFIYLFFFCKTTGLFCYMLARAHIHKLFKKISKNKKLSKNKDL